MGKRDYVLEKADQGDLDALEQILGNIMSPLFDLCFHYLDDADESRNCLRQALSHTARAIVENKRDGVSPFLLGARAVCGDLLTQQCRSGRWEKGFADLPCAHVLAILVQLALDLHDDEAAPLAGLDPGDAAACLNDLIRRSGHDEETWRQRLDDHAGRAFLPGGLIDDIMSEHEES